MTRTVVVTGITRGLGAAVGRAFLTEGADVVGCAREPDELDAFAAEATGPGELTLQRADVRDAFDVERMMETAARGGRTIDTLFANAGVYHGTAGDSPLVEESYSAFDDHLRVNGRGVFAAVKEALPHMAGDARVLVPAGPAARDPEPGYGSYHPSKTLAVAIVRQLAAELDQTVGIVDPGRLTTNLFGQDDGQDPEAVAGLVIWAATTASADAVDGEVLSVTDWREATA